MTDFSVIPEGPLKVFIVDWTHAGGGPYRRVFRSEEKARAFVAELKDAAAVLRCWQQFDATIFEEEAA